MTDTTDCPLITFAVIAYTQEHYIREAIEGAFAQTYQPLEIILSDDCSPDRTFDIMQEMAAAYDGPHRVRLNRNEQNLGVVQHVNRIFALASGELICVNAGDDISIPGRTDRLFREWYHSHPRPFLIHSAATKIDEAGQPHGHFRPDDSLQSTTSPRLLDLIRNQKNGIGATFASDRRIYEHFQELPEFAETEDRPLFFRAAALGPIHYIDEPLVMYRLGGISSSSNEEPVYSLLFGDRIKLLSWKVAAARSMLSDLKVINDFPEKRACRQAARRIIRMGSLEVDLSRSSGLRFFLLLPRTLLWGLRYLTPKPFRMYVKYVLYFLTGKKYVLYFLTGKYSDRVGKAQGRSA